MQYPLHIFITYVAIFGSCFAYNHKMLTRERTLEIKGIKSSYFETAGTCLSKSGELIVAAAALLGEYGHLNEDPASLSFGGCAISNAGQDLLIAGKEIDESKSWELCILNGISPAADHLRSAAATLHFSGDALVNCVLSLEKACEVTGCLEMASAASDDFLAAGSYLKKAGEGMRAYGVELRKGSKVEDLAGLHLIEAGELLSKSGFQLSDMFG